MATAAVIFLGLTASGAWLSSASIANEDGDTWIEAVSYIGLAATVLSAIDLLIQVNP